MTRVGKSGRVKWRSSSSIEFELRPLLQDVRLVAELDLSPSGTVYENARRAFQNRISLGLIESLSTVCPAATVIFLVAEGIHCYEGGTFWPNLSVSGISTNQQNAVGEQFLRSLIRLQLNTFDDVVHRENALPFLTPILLHGGIPAYSAGAVWERLIEETSWGQEDAGRIVARWRRYPYLLQGVGKPSERFILHGGDFAVDLIQRMIQLGDDVAALGRKEALRRGATALAADTALPRYLADELLKGPSQPLRVGPRPPRPRVVLDPYSGEGPRLLLPPSPTSPGTWRVFWKGKQETYRTSFRDERQVSLDPAAGWEVTFLSDHPERTTTLGPMENMPVYIFDDTGELARNQTSIRGESVLILASRSMSFYASRKLTKKVPEVEEIPGLAGKWSGWQARHLNIAGLTEVTVAGTSRTGETLMEAIGVTESTRRPRLLDDHLPGVGDTSGGLVFSKPPRILVDLGTTSRRAWRVRLRTSEHSPLVTLADLETDSSDPHIFDLAPLFEARRVVSGVIEVLGPLGSDLRVPVTIVPGLKISMPKGVFGPNDSLTVRLSANVPLDGSRSTQTEITFPPGQYTSRISAGAENVDLLMSVPRLVWALRYREGQLPSLGAETKRITLDEFANGEVEAVVVRVGRPATVRLELHGTDLIQMSEEQAGGVDGRWTFSLAEFQTSVAHAQAARLHLRVVCQGVTVNAAVIEAVHKVSAIRMKSIVNLDGEPVTEVRWRENTAFKNREIRLWSDHRPWEPPTSIPVPDANRGHCDFEEQVPPGPYLLDVGIRDPWTSPTRPPDTAANATRATIGTGKDLRNHLATLDAAEPVSALELELAGRGPVRSLDEGQVESILGELKAALFSRHGLAGPNCASDQIYVRLAELTLLRTRYLAEIISDIEKISPADLARLLITLVQGIVDCAPRGIAEPVLDRLWRMSPVAGAAFDIYREGDERCAGRWLSFTGWDPTLRSNHKNKSNDNEHLPSGGAPIKSPTHIYTPAQLRDLASELLPSEVRVLKWSGHFEATLDFLIRTHHERALVDQWQMKYGGLADDTRCFQPVHVSYLRDLENKRPMPRWCHFPRDLMACAFHLLVFGGNSHRATKALWDAVEFAPELANRSLLIAIVLHLS